MVFDDHVDVTSARTNEAVIYISLREVIGIPVCSHELTPD